MKEYIKHLKFHTMSQIWNYIRCKAGLYNDSFLLYNPISLIIRITSRCDQRCSFCTRRAPCNSSELLKFEDMSLKNFIKFIDRFKDAIIVQLTGGEPLLHTDLSKMIEYAHLKKMYTKIVTNGVTLNDKMDAILKSPLNLLNISLDATNPSDYRTMHGAPKNVFYLVLENIETIVEKRNNLKSHLKFRISYICTKQNYRNIPDMVHLAEELGMDELLFVNLIPYNLPGFSIEQALFDDNSDVVEVINNLDTPKSNMHIVMPKLLKHVIKKRFCRMPFTTLTIDGDGHYYYCCLITSPMKFDKVMDNENVWNNSYFQNIRKVLLNESNPLPHFCRTCPNMNEIYKVN